MRNWAWTPRAKAIGTVISALATTGALWFIMSAGWFMLGGI